MDDPTGQLTGHPSGSRRGGNDIVVVCDAAVGKHVLGMTKTPSQVTNRDPDEFRYCTPAAIDAIQFLRGLHDEELTDPVMVRRELGEDCNPNWVAARCLEERYERGLLSDDEFDRLVRAVP